eukprot:5350490-Pyramimonas_sp.AAC.1
MLRTVIPSERLVQKFDNFRFRARVSKPASSNNGAATATANYVGVLLLVGLAVCLGWRFYKVREHNLQEKLLIRSSSLSLSPALKLANL